MISHAVSETIVTRDLEAAMIAFYVQCRSEA